MREINGKRIMIISSAVREVDPYVYGGLELIVYNLAEQLNKLKDEYGIEEVAVACCQHSRLPKGVTYIPTVEPTDDPNVNWIEREEEAYNIYEPHLKDFEYIISMDWFGFPYIYKLKNPNVFICHVFHGMPTWNSNPPINEDPNYIAASRVQADMIFNRLGVEATVIHHGIDTELYKPAEDPSRDYYLFLNRIMREKGAIEFIKVCERAKVRGIVAGEDKFVSDQNYVEKVKELCEKSDYVEYKGRVSLEEKIELLQNAKAVVGLSMFPFVEIFGLFCAEALSCKTPVISIANGGLIDQLSFGSLRELLCYSVEDVVEKIKTLEDKRNSLYYDHLAWSCRVRAVNFFSKEVMAKKYLDYISSRISL